MKSQTPNGATPKKGSSKEPVALQENLEPSDGNEPLPFLVVAVGASAGGLEAFSELLRTLPSDAGMAFVLIRHLDPKHGSILSELIAKETRMPALAAVPVWKQRRCRTHFSSSRTR